jgi:hypothetical protein
MSEVTRILSAIEEGDPHAAEQLLPLVYDELRGWQPRRWRGSNPGKRSKPRPWSMRRTCGWWTYTRRSTGTAAGTSSRRRPKPCGAAKVIGLLEFQTAVAEIFAVDVLPGVRFPELLGFQQETIEHTFIVPREGQPVRTPESA